jgi:hypothetical protein
MELEDAWKEQLEIQDQENKVAARIFDLKLGGPLDAEQLAELATLWAEDLRLRERYKEISDEIEPARLARELPRSISEWKAATSALASLVSDSDDYASIAARMAEADGLDLRTPCAAAGVFA